MLFRSSLDSHALENTKNFDTEDLSTKELRQLCIILYETMMYYAYPNHRLENPILICMNNLKGLFLNRHRVWEIILSTSVTRVSKHQHLYWEREKVTYSTWNSIEKRRTF